MRGRRHRRWSSPTGHGRRDMGRHWWLGGRSAVVRTIDRRRWRLSIGLTSLCSRGSFVRRRCSLLPKHVLMSLEDLSHPTERLLLCFSWRECRWICSVIEVRIVVRRTIEQRRLMGELLRTWRIWREILVPVLQDVLNDCAERVWRWCRSRLRLRALLRLTLCTIGVLPASWRSILPWWIVPILPLPVWTVIVSRSRSRIAIERWLPILSGWTLLVLSVELRLSILILSHGPTMLHLAVLHGHRRSWRWSRLPLLVVQRMVMVDGPQLALATLSSISESLTG
jgi:hypothetical protein